MALSGHTIPYAVLGHPIGHTLSPVMHNASFEALGLDAIYLAFDVAPENLMTVLPAMQQMGFGGVNLTVPLKEVAFEHLPQLDESAQVLGAVNTVAFGEDGLKGYNTDGLGFLTAMQEAFGPCIERESVFVLGTGGAGRAVALVCAGAGASKIVLTDIDVERAKRVAAEIRERYPDCQVKAINGPATEAAHSADIIVQSTPIGMKPNDPTPLAPEAFRAGQKAFDLIYMYPETPFLTAARSAGGQIANGLGMLLHQGAAAFRIWSGQDADTAAMRRALEQAVYGS